MSLKKIIFSVNGKSASQLSAYRSNASLKPKRISSINYVFQNYPSNIFNCGQKYTLATQIQSNNYHTLSICTSSRNHQMLRYQSRSFSMAWLDSYAIAHAQWFQSISQSGTVLKVMSAIETLHTSTNTPWWLTIIFGTIFMRTVLTLPLVIYQNYIMAKYENIHPEMSSLVVTLKKETAWAIKKYQWDEKTARFMYNRSAKRMWKELILRDNCHPFKATAPIWIQIPFWIATSIALRNMLTMMPKQDFAAKLLQLGLSAQGFLWVPNLCIADASLILPVLFGLTNLLIIEVNVCSRPKSNSKVQKVMTNAFRFISLALVPVGAVMPAGILLYWTTSSICALGQNLLVMHPRVRKICGIPTAASSKEDPYGFILNRAKERLRLTKS